MKWKNIANFSNQKNNQIKSQKPKRFSFFFLVFCFLFFVFFCYPLFSFFLYEYEGGRRLGD